MKRLVSLFVTTLSLIVLTAPAAAAPQRFWTVNMSQPTSETASRTIKVNYNVQSTIESDTFVVTLLENGTDKSAQNVATPYGDSGVFSIDIPSTGTYTYQVEATNNGDATTKQSAAYTVEVVNAPEPTVNVVTVGGGAGAGAAGDQDGVALAAANGGQAGDEVAQADGQENGETTDEAAGDQNEDGEEGDVLGAESIGDRVANTAPYVLIPAAIAILGLMFYRARQAADQE